MVKTTGQMKRWSGEFGRLYTHRNSISVSELDSLYKRRYGVTRTKLNNLFIGKLDRNIKILEVGSNIGNQLLNLQKMGFKELYGIEINKHAIEISKSRTRYINIIQGSALDIPFKDKYFDLVFTSGVLIHISPLDLKSVIKEMYRCTKKYIWGMEYYSDKYTEIKYRGHGNLLWKADFQVLFTKYFHDLRLIRARKLKYSDSENVDAMYLLTRVTK